MQYTTQRHLAAVLEDGYVELAGPTVQIHKRGVLGAVRGPRCSSPEGCARRTELVAVGRRQGRVEIKHTECAALLVGAVVQTKHAEATGICAGVTRLPPADWLKAIVLMWLQVAGGRVISSCKAPR